MKKTTIAKKLKMKKMFAAVQTIVDREDPEDSSFEVIGVYASKKTAQTTLDKAREKFLLHVNDDLKTAEEMIDDDYDRTYEWKVVPVKVEA